MYNQTPRVLSFLLFLSITAVVFRWPLAALTKLSLNDERYSYVSLIPVITLSLIFLSKKAILNTPRCCPALGIPLMVLGILLCYRGMLPPALSSKDEHFSATICGIVLIWIAAFILIFGLHALRVASFPFSLLLLMIPIPVPALNHLISAMQYSSAYLSGLLFKALKVPVLRQGLTISLPGFDINIAEQCSGIRSSAALVLASSLAGYVFLRVALNRCFLIFITIPIVIVKNAIRIVTLSSLALYVNQGFLFGHLHRYGGLCFSLLDLVVVIPLVLQLHKLEARNRIKSFTRTQHYST
jgi:exosortase